MPVVCMDCKIEDSTLGEERIEMRQVKRQVKKASKETGGSTGHTQMTSSLAQILALFFNTSIYTGILHQMVKDTPTHTFTHSGGPNYF